MFLLSRRFFKDWWEEAGHTSCGRLTLKLEELGFHLGELLLQRLHCFSVLFLQMSHLLSEAAAKGLVLGRQLTHHLRVFGFHCHILGLYGTQLLPEFRLFGHSFL